MKSPGGTGGPQGADRSGPDRAGVLETVRASLREAGLVAEQPSPAHLVVSLPGEHKLSITCSLKVGRHSLSVNAFVMRAPAENHEQAYRWLLRANTRTRGVAFALDRLGDVYLVGRLPLAAVDAESLDRLLGAVLEHADSAFDTLVAMGFASSIRQEWRWRIARGESTANLEPFRHLMAGLEDAGLEDAAPEDAGDGPAPPGN